MPIPSVRVAAANRAAAVLQDFYFHSRYGYRRHDPGIADFRLGVSLPAEGRR